LREGETAVTTSELDAGGKNFVPKRGRNDDARKKSEKGQWKRVTRNRVMIQLGNRTRNGGRELPRLRRQQSIRLGTNQKRGWLPGLAHNVFVRKQKKEGPG